MISLTGLRNLLLEYRLPLVCTLLVLILIPIVIFQLAAKNVKNTPKNVQIARPIGIADKTQGIKITYTGANLNLPKKISPFTQDLGATNLSQASTYAKLLSVESQPKQLSPGSEAYIWTDNNTTITFSSTAQRLGIMKYNIKSGQNNDINVASQKLNGLLAKLGININTTLSTTPSTENLKQMILDPENGKPVNADFLQLTFSQSVDGIPVIAQNPDNYSVRARFVFGEIQNLEVDLGVQSAPVKGKEEKTIDSSKILKQLENGGGVFISATNPEEDVLYSTKSKTLESVELKSGQVAYYRNLAEKIDLIPVVLFSGTAKFTSQETRNVRIITPLTASYTFTQP